MNMEQYIIDEHNHKRLAQHRRRFDFAAGEVPEAQNVIDKLKAFNIAIPSWALILRVL